MGGYRGSGVLPGEISGGSWELRGCGGGSGDGLGTLVGRMVELK